MLRLAVLAVVPLAACLLVSCGDAFVVAPLPLQKSTIMTPTVSSRQPFGVGSKVAPLNMARPKKKRRRRQKDGDDSNADSASSSQDEPEMESFDLELDGNELPDFDFDDGEGEPTTSTTSTSSAKKIKRTNLQENEITDAMMDSGSSKPVKSVKELLKDRSLEANFQFEEPDDPLPDLADFRAGTAKEKIQKSKGRRKSGAGAVEENEPNSVLMFLRTVPVIGDPIDEKGEINAIKVRVFVRAGCRWWSMFFCHLIILTFLLSLWCALICLP